MKAFNFYEIKSTTCNNTQLADKKFLLHKLLARGKVYVAQSDRKSRRVLGAHLRRYVIEEKYFYDIMKL